MAVILSGTGGIFKRCGHLMGGSADVVAEMGGTATARTLSGASWQTRGTTIDADAAESPSLSQVVDGVWQTIVSWQSTQYSFVQQMAQLAQKVFIAQVMLDAHLPSANLTSCLIELIRQMRVTSDAIAASTVAAGAQTAVGTPTGNPIILLGFKNTRGDTVQTPFAETIRFIVTADQFTGGTLRQEPMSVQGAVSVPTSAYNWPQGSGSSSNLTLVDAQLDNGNGNKLVNSDWETFVANYPSNWLIRVGTAGTDIKAGGSSPAYTLANCLEFAGDGATLSTLYQQFGTATSTTSGAGGTPFVPLPATRYGVNLFSKVSAAPATGILRVALVDGSNAVINDDAGNANSFTVDLTAETTAYAAHSGEFVTPTAMPAVVRLELRISTAVETGKNVFIDDLAFTPMTELYAGGPTLAAFAGSTAVVKGDAWNIAVTNTFGLLALWLERFFSLRDKRLQFPYASGGSITVPDSVVA